MGDIKELSETAHVSELESRLGFFDGLKAPVLFVDEKLKFQR